MAITPPRSGVQLLNPASLIGGQQRNTGGNLDQFINFALQQKLQQSSQAFQDEQRQIDRDLDMEQFLLGAQASGQLVKADDPRLASLPGEANFTQINYGGKDFVLGREVDQAALAQANTQTIDSFGGKELFEGTTVGDIRGFSSGEGIAGPTGGSGSQAATRLDDFAVANKQDSISKLEAFRSAIQGQPEFEGLVASVNQHIATVQADEQFSLTEAKALDDQYGIDKIKGFVESVAALQEQDQVVASGVGAAAIDFRSSYEIETFDANGNVNGRRNLNPYEAWVQAKVNEGVETTDQEFADWQAMPPLLARRDIMDLRSEMLSTVASLSTDAAMSTQMLYAINTKIFTGNKYNQEHPLYRRIETDMGTVSTGTIDQWIKSPASTDFRQSYSLHDNLGSVSRIQAYERQGGFIPFNVERAINAPGSFVFKDVEYTSGLGRGTHIQGPMDANAAAEIEGAAMNFINSYAGNPELLGALDAALNSGDYSTMVGAIQEQMRIADAIAADPNLHPDQQEQASRHSQNLSFLASVDSTSLAALSAYIRNRN